MGRKLKRSVSLIDLDALPPSVRSQVLFALETAQQDYSLDEEMRDACKSANDADLMAFAEREYRGAPIGLSNWYDRIHIEQETIFNRVARNKERRPVFLRGSKNVLIRRHCRSVGGSSPNGWAIDVFWRFVRLKRLTALNFEAFEAATDAVVRRLGKRYGLTRVFYAATCQTLIGFGSGMAVIGGKVVFLSDDARKRIVQIYRLVRKAERLEQTIMQEAA